MKSMKMRTASYFQKHSRDLTASFVLSVTIFLIAPLSVFQVNQNTLAFSFADAWKFYLLLTLIVFWVLAFLSIALHRVFQYSSVIYIALSMSFLIQGNFLIYRLGKLDGHSIQWDALYKSLPLELAIWVGLISASTYFRKFFYKNMLSLATLIMLFSVFSILGTGISDSISTAANSQRLYYDFSNEFEFSSDKNVIILILDTFRSDAFSEIISGDPKIKEDFKDFTYYSNASAGYPTTRPSIPLILTGTFTDNSKSMSDFISSVRNQSLPYLLNQVGWVIEEYPYTTPFPSTWENLRPGLPQDKLISLVKKQLVVTAIRYMPLPLKPLFVNQYYQGGDYYHKNIIDFFRASDKTSKDTKPPTFKFIHLSGVHPPYQLDASLEFADKGYMEQARGNLNAVDRLLEEMRRAGVYNNSMIIILGDHGFETPLPFENNQLPNPQVSAISIVHPRITYIGRPLLLAKGFQQEQDALSVSDAPVSISDIPKTVADTLGMENDFSGYSIFEEVPEDRNRKYFFYYWEHSDWNSDYLPTLYEYEITGNVSDINSWKFLLNAYTGNGQESVEFPVYQYGTNIISTVSAIEYWPLLAPGFERFQDSQEGVWASGPLSCIHLPVIASNKFLSLSMEGFPFLVEGKLTKQDIDIYMDQDKIASIITTANMSLTVPPTSAAIYTSDQEIQLCFGFPDAQSPNSFGINSDSRRLGYYFSKIVLDQIDAFQLPLEVSFKKNQSNTAIRASGWSEPENDFTWTDGKIATLQIPLQENDRDLIFEFSAMPFLVRGKVDSQPVIMRVNGNNVGELIIDHSGEYSIAIPVQYLSDIFNIEFTIPNATSGYEQGVSQGTRKLGIAVHWIRLRQK